MGTMAFFATLIFAYYSATLISILMVTKVNPPFDSYNSLYKTDYGFGYISGTSIDEFFQVSIASEILKKQSVFL